MSRHGFCLRGLSQIAVRRSLHACSIRHVLRSQQLPRNSIIVLVPPYAPEYLTVAVQFPSTLAELEVIVQQEREHGRAMHCPFLCPAYPQTIASAGVFLAQPHWDPGLRTVAVDTLSFDCRLFSVFSVIAPAYLDARDALHLAGLYVDSQSMFPICLTRNHRKQCS